MVIFTKLPKLLDKITSILAAVVGTLELALPIIKEALVNVIRICGVVFYWTEVDEKVIKTLNKIYDKTVEIVDKMKNFLLKLGK